MVDLEIDPLSGTFFLLFSREDFAVFLPWIAQLLGFPESAIKCTVAQQFFVRTKPDTSAAVQHQQTVGVAQRG